MIQWFVYAIIGTIVYTLVAFVDKYNLEKQIKDYRGMSLYSAIVGLITGTVLWFVTGRPLLDFRDGFLIILTGVMYIWSAAIYFFVMQREKAVKVIFLFQLIPIFTFGLSQIFLHEAITLKQLFGFFLILLPTLIIAGEGGKKSDFVINKNTFLMILVDLGWAGANVLFKFVVDTGSFSKVVAYESWGWAVGGVILFIAIPSVRDAFITTTRSLKKSALATVFGNEALFLFSKLFTFLAFSLGSVAIVSVISGTQVLFAVIFGWILALIAPKVFFEDISRKSLIIRFILGLITVVGLWFVY